MLFVPWKPGWHAYMSLRVLWGRQKASEKSSDRLPQRALCVSTSERNPADTGSAQILSEGATAWHAVVRLSEAHGWNSQTDINPSKGKGHMAFILFFQVRKAMHPLTRTQVEFIPESRHAKYQDGLREGFGHWRFWFEGRCGICPGLTRSREALVPKLLVWLTSLTIESMNSGFQALVCGTRGKTCQATVFLGHVTCPLEIYSRIYQPPNMYCATSFVFVGHFPW